MLTHQSSARVAIIRQNMRTIGIMRHALRAIRHKVAISGDGRAVRSEVDLPHKEIKNAKKANYKNDRQVMATHTNRSVATL